MKNMIKYGVGLIGTYLLLNNFTGTVKVMDAGASGVSKVTKTFQGR